MPKKTQKPSKLEQQEQKPLPDNVLRLPGLGGPPPAPPENLLPLKQKMELVNRSMIRLMAEKEFDSAEETNAFINETLSGGTIDEVLDSIERSPEEEALELAFQARAANEPEEMFLLCLKALILDPYCVDALTLRAEISAETDEELALEYMSIIRRAEHHFGAAYMQENTGNFWGIVETRPYMRARLNLMFMLMEMGHIETAIFECEGLLELNPNDNQGVRDVLRGLYLETRQLDDLKSLNKKYDDDCSAICLWSKVLALWLAEDRANAKKMARKAHKENKWVRQYLVGKKKVPNRTVDSYALGSVEEACYCFDTLGVAWELNPEAIQWLKALNLPG